ncbi:glycosyltransferase family 4 protein [Mucilaginibacter segetis]|uniref:Glycosyltransferase family 4 protein n=1 Tax=Mucilaginibacter segetis TaxID=2793071 RepID=A0A934ULQ2_9SPHI|nr:glycosyltransferase family 4 protein [Mucilaginibacter segetis]MBK0378190.1 glycosyltransferase family 4 protein [Mucilaginibacter segetis]
MKKLAIITTHPIQYYAPIFQLLHGRKNIEVIVFYTWGSASLKKHDPGFEKEVEWDTPVLEGYPYKWVKNTSRKPGSHNFMGIINPDLINDINNWCPDVLLVFGWSYYSHLKVLRYFKNKLPVFFRGDSTLLDEKPGIKSIFKSVLLKWIYKHVNNAFYCGTNNKAYFKKYGLKDEQLIFAPHAIDNERFYKTDTIKSQDIRSKLHITGNDILILFAGKFIEKKDPTLLLHAFHKLNKPNCHLLFAGNGPLEASLKAKAEGNRNIHFLNFQNQQNMPALYHACDLFCLPSKGPGESWGLTVNEAMACNKAILVSDKVGCAIDLVKPELNGFIFKSSDENNLLKYLQSLTRSKNILSIYGENSGQLIKDWNFIRIAKAIEDSLISNNSHFISQYK